METHAPSAVVLRDVLEDDLPIFFEHQLDSAATRMAAFQSRDRQAFMAHWAKVLANPTGLAQTIMLGDQVAGNIVSFEYDGVREVGYWIGRQYWGQGVATRALSAFLERQARPLYAHVAKHNRGSLRVLNRTLNGLTERPQSILFGGPGVRPGPGEDGFAAPAN